MKGELPVLGELVRKVAAEHGPLHPELAALQHVYAALAGDLLAHLEKEEHVLFPMIQRLPGGTAPAVTHCGHLHHALHVIRTEHEAAAAALAEIRCLMREFAVPEGACPSYREMLARPARLERDIQEHVHEEEDILFLRQLALG